MRELSTNELDTVIGGGSVSYPGVYIQELSGNVTSIPGVSTSTGPAAVCVPKQPFPPQGSFPLIAGIVPAREPRIDPGHSAATERQVTNAKGFALLRGRGTWPRDRRTAQQSHKLAAPHASKLGPQLGHQMVAPCRCCQTNRVELLG